MRGGQALRRRASRYGADGEIDRDAEHDEQDRQADDAEVLTLAAMSTSRLLT
jgi:hypothetical protein